MSGNLWLIRTNDLNQKAYANFIVAHQIDQPQPRAISERLKKEFHIEGSMVPAHETYFNTSDKYDLAYRLRTYSRLDRSCR
jgi:hypothetical protein